MSDAAAAAPPPTAIVDDERLYVGHRPGTTGVTAISFSGVGLGIPVGPKASPQRAEFVGTLAEAGAGHHGQIFVIDRRRSWMNDVADQLVPVLRDLTATERTVVTLGNIMGGYAATWIAGQLPTASAR